MSQQRTPRVALLGEGARAECWASALRPLANVVALPQHPRETVEAVVIAPGASDPFARAKEALQAAIPVLYAAPFLLSPWQAGLLGDLSAEQRLLLRFAEPFQYRPGFAFLRRLLQGQEPFWRPLYLRLLSARPNGQGPIDDVAMEELALCEALLGEAPQHVAATGRRNERGDVCAAFLTLQYAEGLLVQCTVSVAEPTPVRELVAVTAERTLIMDKSDAAAPLRILGGDTPAATPCQASTASDPVEAEAQRFLDAVATGSLAPANSERWQSVSKQWATARRAMSVSANGDAGLADTEPPPLRVIEGGGRTVSAAARPPLTVVSR